jgi:hypothetical protein
MANQTNTAGISWRKDPEAKAAYLAAAALLAGYKGEILRWAAGNSSFVLLVSTIDSGLVKEIRARHNECDT